MESVWNVAYKYCSDSSYIFLSKSWNNPGKLNQSTLLVRVRYDNILNKEQNI